jgi:hypothetical protein
MLHAARGLSALFVRTTNPDARNNVSETIIPHQYPSGALVDGMIPGAADSKPLEHQQTVATSGFLVDDP